MWKESYFCVQLGASCVLIAFRGGKMWLQELGYSELAREHPIDLTPLHTPIDHLSFPISIDFPRFFHIFFNEYC